ncbi:MAG: DUF5007 domain-containing protein [Bacteroidetes bacterium]|nr:DUF5007 domain-containing protein [Bacteroidota bacterium]
MKSLYKYFLLASVTIAACQKVTNGYLSSQVRYADNPIQIARGIVTQTNPVDADGSSAPVTYELLDIRDSATQKHADALFTNHQRYVFTGIFDPNVDTTIALLNSVRKLIDSPCFDFNSHTGAFTFYNTTDSVPLGTYTYDIKATNEMGSKIYKNIATFTLFDGLPYENDGAACAWFTDGTTTSGDIGTPNMDIQRQSTNGVRVILKIVDQNGVAFKPSKNEYIPRGDRSSFQTFARFHPLIVTDTALICDFELTPFPLIQGAQGYTIYYRIPSNIAKVDPGITPTPDRMYSVNPRFTFRLWQGGTYLVTIRLPHVTRDPI